MGAQRQAPTLALLIVLVLSLFVAPAAAQDPYPPPDPPPPPPSATVECGISAEGRTVICEGEGFLPGSTVTLSLRATGPPGGILGTGTATVGPDGRVVVSAEVPCDYDRSTVLAQVSGRDAADRPVQRNQMVNISGMDSCGDVAQLPAGDASALPGANTADDDVLPFLGAWIALLVLLAAVLIGLGLYLVRRRRPDTAVA